MSNKQQLLKDFVSQQIQNSKQQTQPIVNSDGFKNGEPPAGSNWRIPGDTLYNPTPYPIQAVSDNGITKTLNPFDESTVEFPGAKYVDEYQMKFGGLPKYQGDTGPSQVIEDTTPRPTLNIQAEGPGFWERLKRSNYNPYNWGLPDYSELKSPREALYKAAYYGEPEFMWRGRRQDTNDAWWSIPEEDRLANVGKANWTDKPFFIDGNSNLYTEIVDNSGNYTKFQKVPIENVKQYQKAYTDALNYTKEWVNSPMYKKMLKESTIGDSPKYFSNIERGRRHNLATASPSVNITSQGDTWSIEGTDAPAAAWSSDKGITVVNDEDDIPLSEFETKIKNRNLYNKNFYFPEERDVLAFQLKQEKDKNTKDWLRTLFTHEFSHHTDKNGTNSRLIPKKDVEYILNNKLSNNESRNFLNTLNDSYTRYSEDPKAWNSFYRDYVGEPTEVRARLQEIRQYARNNGIYDPFTQEVDDKTLEKLIDDNRYVPGLNDLINIYKPEQIKYMLNHISENKTDNQGVMSNDMQFGKKGGLTKYQNAGLVATSPYERIPQSWKEKYDWTPNVEEEYIRFKNDPDAPDNLRFTDDLNDYNVRGMWDSLERPVSWEQALILYKDLNGEEWVPEEDGYYHAWSQHPGTGEWLKPKHHSTAWMNFAGYPMDPYSRVVVNPEGFFGDETLQTEYKKNGGLKKYQIAGRTFEELMMEGLRPQSAASDNTYYTNARIEEAKRDDAKNVTPQQKQKAAVAKKKIAAEEKRQQLVAELANQGEIKPAPSEFDSNVAKAYYMASNPMSALGHYAKYGYVPQGNVGNYGLREDQSGMEMLTNFYNPFSWGNAAYRFKNDLTDGDTYTTLGGAGNALSDLLEAAPMLGVMKSGVPSMLQDVSLAKSLANNKINQGISYLESKEGVFGRSPKLASIPESKTLGAPEMSRLADIESGMALQSSRLDPYQKLKKKIEFIESKPNLSEDDVVRMFGKSRKDLYDEFDVMEFNGGRPIEMTPPGPSGGQRSTLNLERPARSQASRDAQAARRANRQQNVQVRDLNTIFQENPETFQQVLNDLPAYQRRNIQLDTSTEGLPRITIADANSLDMEAIRNLMNTVVQKPTITRATDAVKGLFNSNPIYKGEVQKFMPSFHATDYATPRQMLMDVKSKLDQGLTGLRIGDVGTGSTNTSHNSYLNQMDFIAQNAGKQGLSKPVFLGYEQMNPMGYLSNAAIPDDEIFRYINTKLNQIQQKRGVNFNLGQNAPYINEAGSIMIPQYGVRKLDNSFTQIKKQEGGSVLKSFVMSQLQAKSESSDNFDFEDSLSKFVSGGQHGGLDRWFAEKWVDIKSGKPCGRQEGEKRGYPACRPSKRVSEDTPKTSSEMSPSEKAKFKRTKTSSKRIPYNHKRN